MFESLPLFQCTLARSIHFWFLHLFANDNAKLFISIVAVFVCEHRFIEECSGWPSINRCTINLKRILAQTYLFYVFHTMSINDYNNQNIYTGWTISIVAMLVS